MRTLGLIITSLLLAAGVSIVSSQGQNTPSQGNVPGTKGGTASERKNPDVSDEGTRSRGLDMDRTDVASSKLFRSKCAACHGDDAKGEPSKGKEEKLKDLGSTEVQSMTNDELAKFITDGHGKMPAFKDKLTEAQIKDLVAYIRNLDNSRHATH